MSAPRAAVELGADGSGRASRREPRDAANSPSDPLAATAATDERRWRRMAQE